MYSRLRLFNTRFLLFMKLLNIILLPDTFFTHSIVLLYMVRQDELAGRTVFLDEYRWTQEEFSKP